MLGIRFASRTSRSPRSGSFCDGLNRRQWLSLGTVGTLGALGGGMFGPLRKAAAGDAAAASAAGASAAGAAEHARGAMPAGRSFGKAKSCIQIFLWGGPGQQETWDVKLEAPEGTRGEFRPVATNIPGFQICEHLPLLAQRADKYTIVRSLTHTGVNHGTSSYHMLTGHIHWSPGTLRHPSKFDMPNWAANAARFKQRPPSLPAHVQLPAIINDGDGLPVPGQGAGILGPDVEPFQVLGDLTQPGFRVPALALPPEMSRTRLGRRVELQQAIEQQAAHLNREDVGVSLASSYQRALDLLQSSRTEAAFDLGLEPQRVRERYGFHHFAQALLLARRLVEAGVPLITVYWNAPTNTDLQSWDTHSDQHVRMKDHLLPAFDQSLSALLDDLHDRGLIDDTLVAWYGEFGRTPKINRKGGRDHWGFCQSIGLAGGGVQPGICYGASTRDGGYPDRDDVSPDNLAATAFHCLGIDHRQHMYDLQQRPIPLSYGTPVWPILL